MGFVLKTIKFCTNRFYFSAFHLYSTILPDILFCENILENIDMFLLSKIGRNQSKCELLVGAERHGGG